MINNENNEAAPEDLCKRSSPRIESFLSIIILCTTVILVIFFAVARGNVILNRYTDSIWHMAAADEFARTGVFAKDPFISNAPKFAPFGLWDFVNGMIQRCTSLSSEQIFVFSSAIALSLFLLLSFTAGLLVTGRPLYGLLSMFTIYATCVAGTATFLRAGWPFTLALSAFFFSIPLLCRLLDRVSQIPDNVPRNSRKHFRLTASALGFGVLMGMVFDIHPFVGLFSCLLLSSSLMPYIIFRKNRIRLLVLNGIGALGFLLAAFPWLRMHLDLRSILSERNAHLDSEISSLIITHPLQALTILLFLITGCLVYRKLSPDSKQKRFLYFLLSASGTAFVTALPPMQWLIAKFTGTFMAERVLLFVPLGLLAVCLPVCISQLALSAPKKLILTWMLMLAFIAAHIQPLLREVKFLYYMGHTTDYDTHAYTGLLSMKDLKLNGKTILSDPFTSYFARRFLGAYAVTVPSGHASPAVDYAARDEIWHLAIEDPSKALSAAPFDYILLNMNKPSHGKPVERAVLQKASTQWNDHAEKIYQDDSYTLFRVVNGRLHP